MADAGFEARLAAFRHQFLVRLEGRLAAMAAQLCAPGAAASPAVLRDVHAQLHQLAGSGGTFGFHELSRQASTLERQAKVWLEAGEVIAPAAWEAWKVGVLGLRQAVGAADDRAGPAAHDS